MSVISPPFETEYGHEFRLWPMYVFIEPMLTMLPPPRLFMMRHGLLHQDERRAKVDGHLWSQNATAPTPPSRADVGGVVHEDVEGAELAHGKADDQALNAYWGEHGCVVLQPFDLEKGASTMNPGMFLRCLVPQPGR